MTDNAATPEIDADSAAHAETSGAALPPESVTPVEISSNRYFRSLLVTASFAYIVLALIAVVVGFLIAGVSGGVSGLVGVAVAFGLLAAGAGSVLLANRFFGTEIFVQAFFGIVMGVWIVRLIVFVVLAFVFKQIHWFHSPILFMSLIVGIVLSLVLDAVVVMRTRVLSGVEVALPGE